MNRIVFLVMAFVGMLAACNNNKDYTETFIVASREGDCVGVAPQKCLLIKKDGHSDWEFFYGPIKGFDYREGYEYVIRVRKDILDDAPADRSSFEYTLVKVISKTRKDSEGIPEINR